MRYTNSSAGRSRTARTRTVSDLSSYERFLGMAGLAKRAGRLLCGSDAVISAIASEKKPHLVVLASDSSQRTVKQIGDKCNYYGVKCIMAEFDRQSLAHAVGKRNSLISAVGITDGGMANKMLMLYETANENQNGNNE